MRTTSLSVLFAAALAAASLAQTQVAVPSHAADVDGHQSLGLPFGVPGFRSQILVAGSTIAPNVAVLTGLRLRADRPSAPQSAANVPNVTVALSHSSVGLGGLQQAFASNVTGTPTNVFSGTVQLPAQSPGLAGPLAWDIVIAFPQPYVYTPAQGDLLIDIVGNNPTGGFPSYYLDAMQPGGSATKFGVAGDNPSFDFLNLIVSTNGVLEPRLITPGRTLEFSSTLSFTTPPGALALGFDALPQPLDLTSIGAPTHHVYIAPIATVPHVWQQSFIGWYSTTNVAIPNDPGFIGLRIYGQSVLFDPTANALGVLTSEAAEVRLGDGLAPVLMQQVDALDPNAVAGTLVDFGWSQPEFGAVTVLFEGTFQ